MITNKLIIISFLCLSCIGKVYAAGDSQQQNEQLKLGLELLQQKKYQDAEKLFTQLKQQHPDQITFLNNLAVAQMAQGKTEQALESLKTALVADKYYSITQKNVSNIYAYMASKAYTKALDKSKRITKLPPLTFISDIKPTPEIKPSAVEVAAPVKQPVASKLATEAELRVLFDNKMAAWADAWMKGDAKTYIASYSEKFEPSGKLSRKDWLALRRYRLRHSKQVKVSYNQLNMYLNAAKDTAIVEFVQHYKAGKYQDRVRKQLFWKREADTWLITREQVTEKIK